MTRSKVNKVQTEVCTLKHLELSVSTHKNKFPSHDINTDVMQRLGHNVITTTFKVSLKKFYYLNIVLNW
jgi:hypothetical protein